MTSLWAPLCLPKNLHHLQLQVSSLSLLLEKSSPQQLGPLRSLPRSPSHQAPCQQTWVVGIKPTQLGTLSQPESPVSFPGTPWNSSLYPNPNQVVPRSLPALFPLPSKPRAAGGPCSGPIYHQIQLSFFGLCPLSPYFPYIAPNGPYCTFSFDYSKCRPYIFNK